MRWRRARSWPTCGPWARFAEARRRSRRRTAGCFRKRVFYGLLLLYVLQFWMGRGFLYRFVVNLARKDSRKNFNEKAFRVSQIAVALAVLLVSVYLDMRRR
jgi:hypothetical protein